MYQKFFIALILDLLFAVTQTYAQGQYLDEGVTFAIGLNGSFVNGPGSASSKGVGFAISDDNIEIGGIYINSNNDVPDAGTFYATLIRKNNQTISMAFTVGYILYGGNDIPGKHFLAAFEFFRKIKIVDSGTAIAPGIGASKQVALDQSSYDTPAVFVFSFQLIFNEASRNTFTVAPQLALSDGKSSLGISIGLTFGK